LVETIQLKASGRGVPRVVSFNVMRWLPTQKRKAGATKKSRRSKSNGRGASVRAAAEQIGTSVFEQAPRKLVITVPVPYNSPNEWVYDHWRKYWKIKTGWMKRLYDASIHHCGVGKFGQPIQNASLSFHRKGIRELDPDNLRGGLKPIIDCLIKLGFLENDTPDVVQVLDVYQTKVSTRAEQATEITIIDRETHTLR
jgi:hypothetical protein